MKDCNTDENIPALDRIEGAKAIAAFYGLTERQARWRIDRGLIPHAREGERVVASKRALQEHWRRATSGEARAPTVPTESEETARRTDVPVAAEHK